MENNDTDIIYLKKDFARGSLKAPIISLSSVKESASCSLGISFIEEGSTHNFEFNQVELEDICNKILKELQGGKK